MKMPSETCTRSIFDREWAMAGVKMPTSPGNPTSETIRRYLLGEVEDVYATLRKLNPVIKGEDAAHVNFRFKNGAIALWDANRYNEPNFPSPRYTFGECLLEGTNGSIRLYGNGKITIQKLGEDEKEHPYYHENKEFAGDCVYITQKHFIDNLRSGNEFETNGDDYLKSLRVQEAVYLSGQTHTIVNIENQILT